MNTTAILSFTIVMLSVAFTAQSCAILSEAGDKVAAAVEYYCREPLAAREVYRDVINSELAEYGHEISVHCAGDPDP